MEKEKLDQHSNIIKKLKLFVKFLTPPSGESLEDRLQNYYSSQAEGYDASRIKHLRGRQEMIELVDPPRGSVWVDIGCGTGWNLEFLGASKAKLVEQIYLIDLSQSLLEIAKERVSRMGLTNTKVIHQDATLFKPEPGSVDLVTFSYSITMIPNWFEAIERAYEMLKPGGSIGVCDFYFSRPYSEGKTSQHTWFTRHFWRAINDAHGVYPSWDHVPFLDAKFQREKFIEGLVKRPAVPIVQIPYYVYWGKKI